MVADTAAAHRIPAGWYRDKDDPSRRRWWDGTEWTDHYAPVTDSLTLAEHAVHSSEIPIVSTVGAPPARRSIPLTVFVLLVVLTGANTVLLSILASGG